MRVGVWICADLYTPPTMSSSSDESTAKPVKLSREIERLVAFNAVLDSFPTNKRGEEGERDQRRARHRSAQDVPDPSLFNIHTKKVPRKLLTRPKGVGGERIVVFVDPQDDENDFWKPAMVVPTIEWDQSMSKVKPGNCVIRYFEDNSFATVPAHCLAVFSEDLEPFRMFCKLGDPFFQDKGIQNALRLLRSGILPNGFKWPNWDAQDTSAVEEKHSHKRGLKAYHATRVGEEVDQTLPATPTAIKTDKDKQKADRSAERVKRRELNAQIKKNASDSEAAIEATAAASPPSPEAFHLPSVVSSVSDESRSAFLAKLSAFMKTKGTVIKSVPSVGKTTVDLHALYVSVTSRGGMNQVTRKDDWTAVCREVGISRPTLTQSYLVRNRYFRYLCAYEQDQCKTRNELLMQLRYEKGDKVLVFHEPDGKEYPAKILEVETEEGGWDCSARYLVHYAGWKSAYDEWIPQEFVLCMLPEEARFGRPTYKSTNAVAASPLSSFMHQTGETSSRQLSLPDEDEDLPKTAKKQHKEVVAGDDEETSSVQTDESVDDKFIQPKRRNRDSMQNSHEEKESRTTKRSRDAAIDHDKDSDDESPPSRKNRAAHRGKSNNRKSKETTPRVKDEDNNMLSPPPSSSQPSSSGRRRSVSNDNDITDELDRWRFQKKSRSKSIDLSPAVTVNGYHVSSSTLFQGNERSTRSKIALHDVPFHFIPDPMSSPPLVTTGAMQPLMPPPSNKSKEDGKSSESSLMETTENNIHSEINGSVSSSSSSSSSSLKKTVDDINTHLHKAKLIDATSMKNILPKLSNGSSKLKSSSDTVINSHSTNSNRNHNEMEDGHANKENGAKDHDTNCANGEDDADVEEDAEPNDDEEQEDHEEDKRDVKPKRRDRHRGSRFARARRRRAAERAKAAATAASLSNNDDHKTITASGLMPISCAPTHPDTSDSTCSFTFSIYDIIPEFDNLSGELRTQRIEARMSSLKQQYRKHLAKLRRCDAKKTANAAAAATALAVAAAAAAMTHTSEAMLSLHNHGHVASSSSSLPSSPLPLFQPQNAALASLPISSVNG